MMTLQNWQKQFIREDVNERKHLENHRYKEFFDNYCWAIENESDEDADVDNETSYAGYPLIFDFLAANGFNKDSFVVKGFEFPVEKIFVNADDNDGFFCYRLLTNDDVIDSFQEDIINETISRDIPSYAVEYVIDNFKKISARHRSIIEPTLKKKYNIGWEQFYEDMCIDYSGQITSEYEDAVSVAYTRAMAKDREEDAYSILQEQLKKALLESGVCNIQKYYDRDDTTMSVDIYLPKMEREINEWLDDYQSDGEDSMWSFLVHLIFEHLHFDADEQFGTGKIDKDYFLDELVIRL